MQRLRVSLVRTILVAFVLNTGFMQGSRVLAQGPTDWQGSATGLSITQNEDKKTAGLGFVVQAEGWPSILLRGGVQNTGQGGVSGPTGIELGSIKLPNDGSASLPGETVDWAHNEMTFTSDRGSQLKLWVSRLSPALLLQSSSHTLRLLAGNVKRNKFDGSQVVALPEGPAHPKYVAYQSGGELRIQALGSTEMPVSLDQNWLLLWYGENSHFVETKKPLTYSGYRHAPGYLPFEDAYQADVPLLVVFENSPTALKHSDEGGVEVSFADAAGYATLLPLYGRDHPDVDTTENWSVALPDHVLQKAQWWAGHLCSYPVSVNETYAYSEVGDITAITESIEFLSVCAGGTTFAPIPPVLAIAQDALDVSFSGAVIDGNLDTEFGPSLGIEDVESYTWRVAGMKRYTDARRVIINTGHAPPELEQKLGHEVEGLVEAGHFAPWIFSDSLPEYDFLGDIYWLNPADVLYHLVEIAEVVPEDLVAPYIASTLAITSTHPPQDIYNLPLDQGEPRVNFSIYGQDVFDRWTNDRDDVFLKRVPLYNFYALSRYHEYAGVPPSDQTWQKARDALDRDMREQDWATFYWFNGYQDRKVAVVNANRHFAGLVGFVRLAKMRGDHQGEVLGRALQAKAAVLRVGMAKYPRYLYSEGLIELPPQPDWQVRYTAGRWIGHIFNYDWAGPFDDARQVAWLDQLGVYLYDHAGFTVVPRGDIDFTAWTLDEGFLDRDLLKKGTTCGHLAAFRDMVPELARLLADWAPEDVTIYIDKVETLFPHWYAAFAEGMLGNEHNLGHPIDAFQIFVAKALIQQESARTLATYVDIPWLEAGDLFYVHKLAEAIKAYRGTAWSDELLLRGTAGDRTIYLTWSVYTTLPAETTWQVDYQSQTGTLYTPITGIVSPTRAYTLTGLTNYTWYTVTLTALHESTLILESNPVSVMPTDIFIYLPLIIREFH